MKHTPPKHHTIHDSNTFEELAVNNEKGPLLKSLLKAAKRAINLSLDDYPQTFAFRIDLRTPIGFVDIDTKVISRFFDSLKAQIKADEQRRIKAGVRVHRTKVRFIWVKEYGYSSNGIRPHYHLAILLNKQSYRTLGNFDNLEGNMAARVRKAWASALNKELGEASHLVEFPKNGTYLIGKHSHEDIYQLNQFFSRVSYFAKLPQKKFGGEGNLFGASRK